MPDITKTLGKSLGLGGDNEGFVGHFKAAIKSYQGDGVSAQTHKALSDAGVNMTQDEVQDASELVTRQTMKAVPRDATIAMPDGTRVTPLQYQKLQQMLLRRRGG